MIKSFDVPVKWHEFSYVIRKVTIEGSATCQALRRVSSVDRAPLS